MNQQEAQRYGSAFPEDPTERGYLSDAELHHLEEVVRRAKDALAPGMHAQLTRALWELGNLRGLTRELMGNASAAGLIEHARALRAREAASDGK